MNLCSFLSVLLAGRPQRSRTGDLSFDLDPHQVCRAHTGVHSREEGGILPSHRQLHTGCRLQWSQKCLWTGAALAHTNLTGARISVIHIF